MTADPERVKNPERGSSVNHMLIYRLYREEGLGIRKKLLRQRVACVKREILSTA
jgi:hypothetical protein